MLEPSFALFEFSGPNFDCRICTSLDAKKNIKAKLNDFTNNHLFFPSSTVVVCGFIQFLPLAASPHRIVRCIVDRIEIKNFDNVKNSLGLRRITYLVTIPL